MDLSDGFAQHRADRCSRRAGVPAADAANPGPTESQRGCLRVPRGALNYWNLNTRCPLVPGPAPPSRDLEMRFVGNQHQRYGG
jgi:hypothetical protein